MTEYASRDQLTTGDLAEDDVMTSRGLVRVRGLQRFETLAVGAPNNTQIQREKLMLEFGMVNPEMNADEAAIWMRSARGGDIEDVTTMIARLSGMLKESPKEAMRVQLEDDEAAFRNVPGGQNADDSGAPAA
jgi:hypothetical protein